MIAFQSIFKKKPSINPNYSEVLLNNKLDKDFQKILSPFSLIQILTCNFKYTIKDGFITSNSLLASSVTAFSVFVYFVLYFNYILLELSNPSFVWYDSIFSITMICDFIIYNTGFLLLTAIKVLKSQQSVTLVILIHRVFCIYKTENYGIVKLYCLYRSTIAILVILYALECIGKHLMVGNLQFNYVVLDILDFTFEIDMLYSLCLMHLMKINLVHFATQLKTFCLSYQQIELRTRETKMNDMLKTYTDILKSFKIYKETLQMTVN